MTDSMLAFYHTAFGAPTAAQEAKGVFVCGPVPRPRIQQPDELLIRVHASSINPIGQEHSH